MKYRVYVDTTKKRLDGQSPVMLIFEDNGSRFKASTGLTSSVKFTGREFPDNEPNCKAKNLSLGRKLVKIDEYLITNEHVPFSKAKEEIKAILSGTDKKMRPITEFITDFAKRRTGRTAAAYMSTKAKVEQFDAMATFNTIDADWLGRFDEFLFKNGNKAANGRAVHMRNIKAVFNQAISDEITEKYPFRKFHIKTEKVPINNISVEQLREIRDCNVMPRMRIYRDLFMLSFYLCGMNPADLLLLTKENVKNGRIAYVRKKTHKLIDIPLPDEAKEIFARYKGERYLLNVMDNEQNYSKFASKWCKGLKKLGDIVECVDSIGRTWIRMGKPIVPGLTIYSARYTFASIGAELEIPRETVALCLGHSWADVTSHYISYDMKRIDDAVRKIINFVNADKKESPTTN